jgi:glycerol kinase
MDRNSRIDGGMSANDWMAQDLADLLAGLAGLAPRHGRDDGARRGHAGRQRRAGCIATLGEAACMAMRGQGDRRFLPAMDEATRAGAAQGLAERAALAAV